MNRPACPAARSPISRPDETLVMDPAIGGELIVSDEASKLEEEAKRLSGRSLWSTFLSDVPLYKPTVVWKFGGVVPKPAAGGIGGLNQFWLNEPDLELECATCHGIRRFSTNRNPEVQWDLWRAGMIQCGELVLRYRCANCEESTKMYAIRFEDLKKNSLHNDYSPTVTKFGELPPFGGNAPSRVISLVREDRDNFVKGFRCENLGFGVAAFSYYRRVIENQKHRLLDRFIEVAEKIHAPAESIEALRTAKSNAQFSRAMESIKDYVPKDLLIRGENPLTVLHGLLSVGMHGEEDDWCLRQSHAIRAVLIETAKRIDDTLASARSIDAAMKQLRNPD